MPYTRNLAEFSEWTLQYPHARRIYARGDSWFAYPRRFLLAGARANILDWLGDSDDLLIYGDPENGEEVTAMLSGDDKENLVNTLRDHHFDDLLFSGGGNDIVGAIDFEFVLRRKTADMSWRDCIREDRLRLRLQQIRLAYTLLCELVTSWSRNPSLRIVTHTYDWVIPRAEGFRLFGVIPLAGPWVYPYLMRAGIEDPQDQRAVVREMLLAFKATLDAVAQDYPRLWVVDTQGTLGVADWLDEIHPTPDGFARIAARLDDVLGPTQPAGPARTAAGPARPSEMADTQPGVEP